MRKQIDEQDLDNLQTSIAETISDEIYRLGQETTPLAEVQPTSSVCLLAAQAAAAVLIAFERGYRMSNGEVENPGPEGREEIGPLF